MTTRGLSAGQIAAAQGSHRVCVPLVEALFDSVTIRVALWDWDIVDGAITYIHQSAALDIEPLNESSGSTEGMKITLSGLDPAILAIATQEPYQGRVIRVLKARLNVDTNALIDAPTAEFIGRIRDMPIVEDKDKCVVTVTAEHYEAELGRASPSRLNDAHHQRIWPGDIGCIYAESMVEKNIIWPSREALLKK